MPRAGTAARRRARAGLAPAKPGKIGWVHGTKELFFKKHKDNFLAAVETNTQGSFYSKVGQLYLDKYGCHTAWEDNLEDEDDVADDVDPSEDVNTLAAEEAEFRADYFSKLQTKIGVWYNSEYKTDLPTKNKNKMVFTKLFDKRELEPPAPVKMRTLHFYSRNFYTDRVKPRVAARWQALSRLPNPPKMITVRTMVTKEAWAAETQEFREEVELALTKEYETARKAYDMAVSGDSPTTAEEFSVALNNAAYYLQPFADAIHERFGMNIALMLCGPIPDRGGRIEVRSVHSGMLNGLVPRIWSDFDRGGFDIAQRSFVDFTHHCFTQDGTVDPAMFTHAPTPSFDPMSAPVDPVPAFTFPDTQLPTFTFPGTRASTFLGMQTSTMHDTQAPSLTDEEYAALIAQAGGEDQWVNDGEFDVGSSRGADLENLFDPAAYMESGWLVGGEEDGRRESDGLRFGQILQLPPLPGSDGPVGGVGGDVAGSKAGAGDVDRAGLAAADPKVADAPPVVDVDAAGEKAKDRSKPKPAYRGAWAKSVEQAVLERPEVNPEAEGPLNAEGPKNQVAKEVTVTAAEDKDGEEEAEGGGDGGEVGAVWEEQDMSAWPEELKYAYAAFERGQDWGGEMWKACVDALIAMERAQGFRAKGWLSVPSGDAHERPVEVPDFMRYARKWDKPLALTSEIRPTAKEGLMADRWWNWWTRVQPASRMQASGKLKLAEWEDLGKMSGRNGVLLYVGALLWWGEAAAETEDEREREVLMKDWRWAVDDVAGVLRLAAESTISAEKKKSAKATPDDSDKPKPAKKAKAPKPAVKPKAAPMKVRAKTGRGSKRRQPDVPEDKENEPAKRQSGRAIAASGSTTGGAAGMVGSRLLLPTREGQIRRGKGRTLGGERDPSREETKR
ncbi:hypothetical protein C8F04DRAFT_1195171 [Mycena alexandri]|uniref:Uncharacterized protein n=1 Tax=Mycena alexandri TaxID=1745969 RepID=A0AAD6WUP8_9AGAR|nr:hypothetical protein C8F04DRAFT_1195171 [Mycena alexandri]